MEVMGDWWWGGSAGQVLVALFGPAAAVLIGAAAARGGSPRAGWIAALVYLSTPWVYRLASDCLRRRPALFLSRRLDLAGVRGQGGWSAAGAAALGIAGAPGRLLRWAASTPGSVSAVIPFGLLALWTTLAEKVSGALVGCYVLGWAVVMSPWLVKNVIDTRNPVYPLECRVFPSPEWDSGREVKWQEAHGPRQIDFQRVEELGRRLVASPHAAQRRVPGGASTGHYPRASRQPARSKKSRSRRCANFGARSVDVAGRSDWQSPLYVALAPLALLRPGSRRLASSALAVRSLHFSYLVVHDAPARSILAADACRRWRFLPGWVRTGPQPKLVNPPRDRAGESVCSSNLDLHLDGAGGLERVDRRPGLPSPGHPPAVECGAGAPRRGTAARRQATPGWSGGRVPLEPPGRLQHGLQPRNNRAAGQGQEHRRIPSRHWPKESSPTSTSTGKRSPGTAGRGATASPTSSFPSDLRAGLPPGCSHRRARSVRSKSYTKCVQSAHQVVESIGGLIVSSGPWTRGRDRRRRFHRQPPGERAGRIRPTGAGDRAAGGGRRSSARAGRGDLRRHSRSRRACWGL